MTIKELYQLFHQWQENPVEYKRSKAVRQCNNCGDEFHGDYCPTCGQKWDTGPVSWSNLRQQWMDLWGLGTRSLPLTIMQLLLRPGYLIGDYISGKRRNCFSPLSMFLLVAMVVFMIGHWLDLNYIREPAPEKIGDPNFLSRLDVWLITNADLLMLFSYIWMLLPTYIMFRHAPRFPRHTLPQGFFIQVFNATQYVCLLLPFGLICKMMALSEAENEIIEGIYQILILHLLLFVNFKQLFGYGVWGTLWRVVACFVIYKYSIYLIFISIILVYSTLFHGVIPPSFPEWSTEKAIYTCIFICAIIIVTLGIALFANRRSRKKMSLPVNA